MKKTVLGMALVATAVLGSVAFAEEQVNEGNIATSNNTVKITPGTAKVTAAPSYDFGVIEAKDIKKGDAERPGTVVENKSSTLDFTNDTFEDVQISVKAGELPNEGVFNKFNVSYGSGFEVGDQGKYVASEPVKIDAFTVKSGESTLLKIENSSSIGEHKIKFSEVKAEFGFDESNVSAKAEKEYSQLVTWALEENTEGKVLANTL